MEDFVTFEIAVKLKGKGFKEKCLAYYDEEDNVYKINNYLFSYDAKEGIITEVNKKVNKNYLWIAKDSNGELWGYDHKPIKKDGIFQSNFELEECRASELPIWIFPEITFENSPQRVEIKLIENEK